MESASVVSRFRTCPTGENDVHLCCKESGLPQIQTLVVLSVINRIWYQRACRRGGMRTTLATEKKE
jgi:hypothetical protein